MATGPAPLSVRFISRKWPPAMGGMETYSVRIAEELAKRCSLDLIVLPGGPSGRKPGAAKIATFGLVSALKVLRAPQTDVVHVADTASWPLGWLASLRHPNSRVVLAAHGSDISYANRTGLRAWVYRRYLRLGARLLRHARLIANSQWIACQAEGYGFRNTLVVPLGTSITAPDKPIAGGHNGCLFFAGRVVRRKGLSRFVREVLPLLPKPPKIRVAGARGEDDKSAILESPLVEYLGILDTAELAEEYASALCVIVPSVEPEGFGLVVAEAAAAGGLVIASAHSGLLEAVGNCPGFTADPADPAQWARIIEQIRGWTADERMRFIEQHKRDPRDFSWARAADQTLAAYSVKA